MGTSLLSGVGLAQTDVTQSVTPTYNNLTAGNAVPNDFLGLSWGTISITPNWYGVSGYLFTPSNTQLINDFQQIGVKNLRLADGGAATNSSNPAHNDIDTFFSWVQPTGIKVIYSSYLLNADVGTNQNPPEAQTVLGDTQWIVNSEVRDIPSGCTTTCITESFAPYITAFALDNETDFHSGHTYCEYGSAVCTCSNGNPASCSGSTVYQNDVDLNVVETVNPCGTGSSKCSSGTPVGASGGWIPGSAYTSYLAKWESITNTVNTYVPSVQYGGPDTGDYTGKTFTPSYFGTSGAQSWTYQLASDEASALNGNGKPLFVLATQHYYVGGNPGSASAAEHISDMLSTDWVQGTSITTEPSGVGTYTPYPWMLNNALASISQPFRLTEFNDVLGGVSGASNAFAGALWALDAAHWWAANGAAGVNFHNQAWIYTDTIIPSNAVLGTDTCTSACSNWIVQPKGYGIKAFDLGGHGYTTGVSHTVTAMPNSGSLDTYAVGSGQDLYVTLVNKTDVSSPSSSNTASVTIDIATTDAPFVAASVSTVQLDNADSGAPSDPSQLSAELAGSSIVNSGTQWAGYWTGQPAMTSGSETISVPPATAVVVHFHAPSNYSGPIQINQNGALELFATNSSGDVYHIWQKAADLNTEPNSGTSNWNSWTENLSGASQTGSPTGDLAVVRNLDNSLQVFVPTSTDVFYSRQQTPGGAWNSSWTDMGSAGTVLTSLKAGRNADGSLTVFGLDSSGDLWYATENAPGVAWSSWTELSGETIGAGYVVGENLNGRLEVFGVNGGNVYHLWQTLANGWSSWSEIKANSGQTLNAWLQVARNVTGDLYLFALDSSGNVWANYQSSPGSSWQTSWTELPTSGLLTSSPKGIQPGFVAGQDANGCFELFGVQNNSDVYHMWNTTASSCSSSTWATSWASITGSAPSGGFDPHLVVSNTNDGRLQIFAVANSSPNDIWTNWQASISGSWTSWADFGSASSGLILFNGQP
jgi:hypothetical protein